MDKKKLPMRTGVGIIVLNKKSGKPYIILVGQTKKTLSKKFKGKKSKVSLSLSD